MSLKFILFLSLSCIFSCTAKQEQTATAGNPAESKTEIAAMLDSFNVAAANSNYQEYFDYYTDSGTFNGTDATENWDKKAFMAWAKPFFDKNTTWNFTSLQRNIYFGKDPDLAWFDELLSTQMKLCRGSGVVVKKDGRWKVEQYVLSTTVPNAILDTVIKMKTAEEDSIMKTLRN